MSVCGCLGGRTKFHFVMKKKNFLWLIAFALLMPLFALTACSDDDDDDDNDSNGDKTEQTANDGTKVLSKKVTKIVKTYDDNKDHVRTWYFDEDGRLTSEKDTYGSSTYMTTYTYSNDKIEVVDVDDDDPETTIYYLENGRVVGWSDEHRSGNVTYSDGYIESSSYVCVHSNYEHTGEAKYTITNGNLTKIEGVYLDEYYGEKEEETTSISYSSKLNNLNVDITAVLIEMENLGNYIGKRSKNLPSTYTFIEKETRTYNGETKEYNYSEVKNFEYIYEGDYPVKILVDKVEDGEAMTRTYEIFYE